MGVEVGGAYVTYWQSGPWCTVHAEGTCPSLTYEDKAGDNHCNPSWAGVTTWVASAWSEVGGGCCPYTEPTLYDQNLPNCGQGEYCGDKCKAMGVEVGGAYVTYWQSGPWCTVHAEGTCPSLTYEDKAGDNHCNPSWAGVTTWHRAVETSTQPIVV